MSWNEKTWREAAREYHAARGVVIPAHEGANGDGREEPPPVNGPQDYGRARHRPHLGRLAADQAHSLRRNHTRNAAARSG